MSDDNISMEAQYIIDKLQSELEQEREALTDCQKRLDEAEVYLKSYVEHLLQVGPSFNYHLRKKIDTLLSQIKDEGE